MQSVKRLFAVGPRIPKLHRANLKFTYRFFLFRRKAGYGSLHQFFALGAQQLKGEAASPGIPLPGHLRLNSGFFQVGSKIIVGMQVFNGRLACNGKGNVSVNAYPHQIRFRPQIIVISRSKGPVSGSHCDAGFFPFCERRAVQKPFRRIKMQHQLVFLL